MMTFWLVLITGTKIAEKSNGKRMRSAGYLRTDKRILRLKYIRIYLFKGISSDIVITVSGSTEETRFGYSRILHCGYDLHLIEFGYLIDAIESFFEIGTDLI